MQRNFFDAILSNHQSFNQKKTKAHESENSIPTFPDHTFFYLL